MTEENNEIIVVGATSKLGNFICKYPFRVMLILVAAGEIFAFKSGADTGHLLRGLLLLLSVYLPILLLIYLSSDKWCYKIEIDKLNKIIYIYRLFNRKVCHFPLEGINIIISAYCHIHIDDSEFILHATFIHELVTHLPKDTII